MLTDDYGRDISSREEVDVFSPVLRIPEEMANVLPTCGLDPMYQRYIEDVATTYNCPEEFVTIALLAAASAAIGNGVHLQVNGYDNPLMLWFVNIAPSGSNKTSPVRHVLDPLYKLDEKRYEKFCEEYRSWRRDSSADEFDAPLCSQLIIGDTTEEARNKALASNPRGLLTYQPEFKAFFDDFSRYTSGGGEASRLLRLYDGQTLHINRKGEQMRTLIRHPFMTILGDLQPGMLQSTFGNRQFMVSGLNQRFLFSFVRREDLAPSLYSTRTPNPDLQRYWHQVIELIDECDWSRVGGPMTLSPGAESIYEKFYNLMQTLKYQEDDEYMVSVYAKLQIHVLRLAGIVHVLHWISFWKSEPVGQVADFEMEYAVKCMDFFLRNARRVYAAIRSDRPVFAEGASIRSIIRDFNRVIPIDDPQMFARAIGKSKTTVYNAIGPRDA